MKTSLKTLLSLAAVAAAASMMTLTPAAAHSPGKSYSHGYSHSHGKSAYWKYQKRKQARHFHGSHRHHAVRPWWKRSYAWKYRSHRGW